MGGEDVAATRAAITAGRGELQGIDNRTFIDSKFIESGELACTIAAIPTLVK
jgi:hypothetical protein